ncbi:hypothetical protein Cgig2_016773 [Carnegiea gigantea]|uniref:Uncharacterized protein n=1 Tax=Carnegiea gigantea TaxID=171969 RepID=A0A9Q1JUH7_9CARY|nr:hypothetical protein Cgig2_016773 [Carnegiea gigantea]
MWCLKEYTDISKDDKPSENEDPTCLKIMLTAQMNCMHMPYVLALLETHVGGERANEGPMPAHIKNLGSNSGYTSNSLPAKITNVYGMMRMTSLFLLHIRRLAGSRIHHEPSLWIRRDSGFGRIHGFMRSSKTRDLPNITKDPTGSEFGLWLRQDPSLVSRI